MFKRLFYRLMCLYDDLWRRIFRVEKIDELLGLSLKAHSGEARTMNDGTRIEPGDCLAIIHFNREGFIQTGTNPRDYARAALRFRRLLTASLKQLAWRFQHDDRYRQVKALYGMSWLPPHGEKVGFMIERVPDSRLNRLRKAYFRLLLQVFFPSLAARENHRLEAHEYWLTRYQLIKNFGEDADPAREDSPAVEDTNPQTIPPEPAHALADCP